MSVRQSLLAILAQGDCYGYQLRVEFEKRTGSTWPLNVGQVYATLDRLERDGLVTKGATDDAGHVFYSVTEEGRGEAFRWLVTPAEPSRDEFAAKLALALTLPGADAAALLAAQREVITTALARYRAEPASGLPRELIVAAQVSSAEAQLAWLDHCEARLADAAPYGLEVEPPKRGRPMRTPDTVVTTLL